MRLQLSANPKTYWELARHSSGGRLLSLPTSLVVIGGHPVLLNRRTNIIVDVFHFESR